MKRQRKQDGAMDRSSEDLKTGSLVSVSKQTSNFRTVDMLQHLNQNMIRAKHDVTTQKTDFSGSYINGYSVSQKLM